MITTKIGRSVRQLCLTMLIIFGPPIAAVLFMWIVWSHAVWAGVGLAPNNPSPPSFTWGQALADTWQRFVAVWRNGGTLGAVLLLANYVGSFGVIIVSALVALRRWHLKRVFAFLTFSVACCLAFSYPKMLNLPPGTVIWIHRYFPEEGQVDHWTWHVLHYPWYALPIAIALGWLVSLLPIFKPGQRYWLARGMCPKCQYDLKGETDRGCPECGWNRPTAADEPPGAAVNALQILVTHETSAK